MTKEHAKGLAFVHLAVHAGIPWQTIIQWIIQYGLPVVLQLLTVLLPLIFGGKLTLIQALEYAAEYLAAVASGQTPPNPPGG